MDQMAEWYVTQATEDLDEEDIEQKSRLLATLEHQSWLALMNTVSEGMSVEREREVNGYTFIQRVVNPSQKAEFRLYSKQWTLRAELGVMGREGH